MTIEAITVSINFGDYLAETLPRNKPLFNHIVVVTSPNDWLTKDVCRINGVEFVETVRHLDEGQFNKGKVINDGLHSRQWRDWICHIDADTVVPKGFYSRISKMISHKETIYGCHRYMCESQDQWKRYLQTGETKTMGELRRTAQTLPVGYFQLWHSSQNQFYPEDVPLARSTDWRFSKQFKSHVHLDAHVIHLSADTWVRGRDDAGRKTIPWESLR